MKVLFRVDSGNHIGMGHVQRCMTLGNVFASNGHEVIFVGRRHKGYLKEPVENRFKCFWLDRGVESLSASEANDYSKWLGVSWEEDAKVVNNIINSIGEVDLLVVDHYALDMQYEQAIHAKKVLVIDDLKIRLHDCDFLLDQNITADKDNYYKKDCEYFMGPKFALLRDEFREKRPPKVARISKVSTIGVFFGGSDITGECRKVVEAYQALGLSCKLKVLISESHQDYPFLQQMNIELHTYTDDVAGFIAECDLFLGASGTSVWERASLGVPSYIVSVADNQLELSEKLKKEKMVLLVGDGRRMGIQDWEKILAGIPEDLDAINMVRFNSFNMCDGLGAKRVYDGIISKL